jgi:hypothetical protein
MMTVEDFFTLFWVGGAHNTVIFLFYSILLDFCVGRCPPCNDDAKEAADILSAVNQKLSFAG